MQIIITLNDYSFLSFPTVNMVFILSIHCIIPCMFPLKVVTYLLKRLQLSYHKDIITDGYSCGTRRKLSTALALVGHPQILLLVRTHLSAPL